MDELIAKIDNYQKTMTDKMVNATNRIGKATEAYEKAEEEKESLMVGNEEKTEKRLNQTNEHGQILMTINSLYETILKYSDASSKAFIKPATVHNVPANFNLIDQNERAAIDQLGVISETITNFQLLAEKLKTPYRGLDVKDDDNPKPTTYYQKIQDALQNDDMLEDFNAVTFKD